MILADFSYPVYVLLIDTTAGGLLIPKGIILSIVSSQHGNGLCDVRYDIYVIYVCLRIICWVFYFARLRLGAYVPNVASFSGSSIL